MNIKKLISILGLCASLSLAAAPAYSATQDWRFQDDDIDFLLDSDLNLIEPGSGHIISEGDILVAVFEIASFTIDGQNAIPAGQELTGISAIQLVDKGGVWVFEPVTGGLDAVVDSILGAGSAATIFADNGGTAGDGSMVAMFLNSTSGAGGDRDLNLDWALDPATNCTSLADCVEQASLGSLLQIDGFLGDPDEFWQALVFPGGDSIDDVHALAGTSNVAIVNFGLSNIYNTVTPVLFQDVGGDICAGAALGDADGCVQVRGNANILGGQGLDNGAFAHSDLDAGKFTAVPEPSLIALLGFGLLGFGMSSRRKNAY